MYNHAAQVLLRKFQTWRHNGAMALLGVQAWYNGAMVLSGLQVWRPRQQQNYNVQHAISQPKNCPTPPCVFVVRVLRILYIYICTHMFRRTFVYLVFHTLDSFSCKNVSPHPTIAFMPQKLYARLTDLHTQIKALLPNFMQHTISPKPLFAS